MPGLRLEQCLMMDMTRNAVMTFNTCRVTGDMVQSSLLENVHWEDDGRISLYVLE